MSGIRHPSKLRPPKSQSDHTLGSLADFSVGSRVNAAGKPGIVAFIGKTEFAAGQWAGIILDKLIGKF